MRKKILLILVASLVLLSLCACVKQGDLVDMKSTFYDGKKAVVWEDRTYVIFCVVSKNDRGKQIGYVDGDTDDRISEYKGYSSDEWLVNWLPMDGGAMLLKEISVVEIPDGLEAEY